MEKVAKRMKVSVLRLVAFVKNNIGQSYFSSAGNAVSHRTARTKSPKRSGVGVGASVPRSADGDEASCIVGCQLNATDLQSPSLSPVYDQSGGDDHDERRVVQARSSGCKSRR